MRVLASLLLIAAACGSEEGAVLGFEGPEDIAADRVEVVLASAKPDHLTAIDSPRAGYFRQRINIDAIEDVGTLGGLTLRIEPDTLEAPEEAFIPFVFAFQGDALVGVATFAGADGKPGAIQIEPGAVTKFVLTVTPVTHVDAGAPLEPSTGTVVECAGESAWRSGYAWQPPAGPQLRVLLPDPELDGEMKNATMRESDLDCDGHAADTDDCDDLRSGIHPGATETCDGVDSDCDGALMELVSCAGANTCASESVALCIEDGTDRPPACVADASCACSANGGQCASCRFFHQDAGGEKAPCAPAVGKIHTPCSTCEAELVHVNGPFDVTIGPTYSGPFGTSTPSPGYFHVRAELRSPQTFTGTTSIGEVYVALTTDDATILMPIDLGFAEAQAVVDCPIAAGSQASEAMLVCSP